jgi:hypothetical protein
VLVVVGEPNHGTRLTAAGTMSSTQVERSSVDGNDARECSKRSRSGW